MHGKQTRAVKLGEWDPNNNSIHEIVAQQYLHIIYKWTLCVWAGINRCYHHWNFGNLLAVFGVDWNAVPQPLRIHATWFRDVSALPRLTCAAFPEYTISAWNHRYSNRRLETVCANRFVYFSGFFFVVFFARQRLLLLLFRVIEWECNYFVYLVLPTCRSSLKQRYLHTHKHARNKSETKAAKLRWLKKPNKQRKKQ